MKIIMQLGFSVYCLYVSGKYSIYAIDEIVSLSFYLSLVYIFLIAPALPQVQKKGLVWKLHDLK